MKRNELKVGEDYALLAPSQSIGVTGSYSFAIATRVKVLDTEPVWAKRHMGWRSDYGSEQVVDFDGTRHEVKSVAGTAIYEDSKRQAKRSVKVLEDGHYGGPVVTVVPLSQIRLTWAAYEALANENAALRKEQHLAEAKRRSSVEGRKVEIRELELALSQDEADPLHATINAYRDQVTLSSTEYLELLRRAE